MSAQALTPIRRALISVSDKSGLAELGRFLAARGVEILSTGGSARALAEADVTVVEVSAHTGFPEIMDGRVKTLHPKVHGGILARRDLDSHRAAMTEHGIAAIDLVVVNLYPFEATLAAGADAATCVENIEIGGPGMVRAAAKNHDFVTVVTDPDDYAAVVAELAGRVFSIESVGKLAQSARQRLARLGYGNIEIRTGDGFEGWPEESPFDAIIVTAAPERIPQTLIEQLRPGGRMAIPIGRVHETQTLVRVTKDPEGETTEQAMLPVAFVPMVKKKTGVT